MSDKESKGEIDIKKVKELIALMKENDLAELEVACGHDKIVLKRPQPVQPAIAAAAMPAYGPAPAQAAATGTAQPAAAGLVEITSPMVGTFYAAPAPDAEAYVAIGSKIAPDTVVCIVEAMKVMNEIKAETAGTIVEVHCEAGQAVEYGQPLFRVRPD